MVSRTINTKDFRGVSAGEKGVVDEDGRVEFVLFGPGGEEGHAAFFRGKVEVVVGEKGSEGGQVGGKVIGEGINVRAGSKSIKIVGIADEVDAWRGVGGVVDIKVEEGGRQDGTLGDTHPDNTGTRQQVVENSAGLSTVEVVSKPLDEGAGKWWSEVCQ